MSSTVVYTEHCAQDIVELADQHKLSSLCSQWHLSDYNIARFGLQGSPVHYIPLSRHTPDYVAELRTRQWELMLPEPWFPYPAPSKEPVLCLGPCGLPVLEDLQEQSLVEAISAAMDTPLSLPIPLQPDAKTSHTHPINISTLIPPELLPLICSHFSQDATPSIPVHFQLSSAYTLDYLVFSSPPISPRVQPIVLPPPLRPSLHRRRSRTSFTEAIHSAIKNTLSGRPRRHSLSRRRGGSIPSHSPKSKKDEKTIPNTPLRITLPPTPPLSHSPPSDSSIPQASIPLPSSPVDTPATTPIPDSPVPKVYIGNLFLSSCPGKKVRLHGPVKGRSSVCRDLRSDLMRMREFGTRCIICCLDDAELAFLGAPWPEYLRTAHSLGLDVLRIPMPEGLTPLTPAYLDRALAQVLEKHTFQGSHVLVHCRGGVGRAGLVACCWALKLGLCGWPCASDFPEIDEAEAGVNAAGDHWQEGVTRLDTLQLVERMIRVVRHRRSLKAIETYEQVQFLVDYVEYLRLSVAVGDGSSSST